MKKLPIFVTAFALSFTSHAQNTNTEATDSTTNNAVELQEFTIQAPKVIHKADMDVFYPSASAVEHSKNGIQLVRNLSIPTLSINEVMNTITTSGESVQVRINGRASTIEQVKALLPETIKRVEWIDNPGLRYKGATAVLNFIVTNPTLGGSLMVDATNALNCAWGTDYAALKLNNGRSQWGASVGYKITNRLNSHREYSETFTFNDGSSLTRNETPLNGYSSDNHGYIDINYSYVKPDTTTFWIALHAYDQLNDDRLYDGIMTQSNGDDDIHLRDLSKANGLTPSMQAYWEQHFKHNQTIAVDLSSSFYNGRSTRSYTEHNNVTSELLNDVNTSIKDRNQAYGIEADYIKNWTNSRFTAGISYNANRNRSTYENLGGEIYHQRQDKIYFFGEYFQRIKKVTLTAGIGAQYSDINFRETNQGNNSWNLRPRFAATYRYNSASLFSLNFTTWQTSPSLTQTNIAASQTDGIQWRVGNPNITTASSYRLTLRYKYTSNRISGTFSVQGLTSPKAIAPYLYWQDDRLITSYENSKGLKYVAFTIAPQIDVIPEWVMLTGSLHYRIEQSKGNGYRHTNRHLSGDIGLTAYHYGFSLVAQYEKAPQKLNGETYEWGETVSLLLLNYDWKKWSFGIGMICPFNKYDNGHQSLNRYNSNTTHLRLDMAAMPIAKVSFNLQWGRQKRGVNKIVNSDSHVDTSSAGGR